MSNFSDNYYLRKYYLKNKEVPTQSMIRQKMTPNLADVMFKSMTPKHKVLAGLEPSLKGGGNDWYVSPKAVLEEGRVVLKPLEKEYLTKLNHHGIIDFGMKTLIAHCCVLDSDRKNMLFESDIIWKENVKKASHQHWQGCVAIQTQINTEYIRHVLDLFSSIYQTSLNNIERLFHEEAIKEIKKTREESRLKMQNRYRTLLKSQAIMLTEEFREKLIQDMEMLKAEFNEQVEINRTTTTKRVHDLNVDKHVAIEKFRKFLECQNLACQIYVSLKEREECLKALEMSKIKHKKKLKTLTEDSILKDFEIRLAEQKESKRHEFNLIWRKKVCQVVKKFQMFVSYCLNMLPDHAEFFINMEKLMLLQINEAIEDPSAESIIVVENEQIHPPEPKPKPFYLFCDEGYKFQTNHDLCSKRTSSASQLPVIIVNKRCMYAACDNFEQFTNKVKDFIHGKCGDDADIKDELIYDHFVPVKHTSSQQLLEIKLESSLLQVLQQEMSNIRNMPIECEVCKMPDCYCTVKQLQGSSVQQDSRKPISPSEKIVEQETSSLSRNNTSGVVTSKARLEHEREPKLGSYMRYIEPKKCECTKSAKKRLVDHLPVYMKNMSKYETVELPNYETCPHETLKKLVKKAKGQITPPIVSIPSKTKDMGTQYSDYEFDWLCTCFSDSEAGGSKIFEPRDDQFYLETVSPSYMTRQPSSFAIDRAYSLRQLIDDSPELIEIFNKQKDC